MVLISGLYSAQLFACMLACAHKYIIMCLCNKYVYCQVTCLRDNDYIDKSVSSRLNKMEFDHANDDAVLGLSYISH